MVGTELQPIKKTTSGAISFTSDGLAASDAIGWSGHLYYHEIRAFQDGPNCVMNTMQQLEHYDLWDIVIPCLQKQVAIIQQLLSLLGNQGY